LLIRHYLYLFTRTANGWYTERGFHILPKLVPKLINSVVLPETPILEDKKLKSLLVKLPHAVEYQDLDPFWPRLKLPDKFINQWTYNFTAKQKAKICHLSTQVIKFYSGFFPLAYSKITITVLPILFGTKTTFYYETKNDELRMVLTMRKGVEEVYPYFVKALLGNLVVKNTESKMEDRIETWRAREEIVEYLMRHSKIADLANLAKYTSTLQALTEKRFQKTKYKKWSKRYLLKLSP